ncbi:MAG: guanylate kinase [Candidatus Promineifilaceae bacterium]
MSPNETVSFSCPDYPVLVLISGPSAVGKDTIARGVIARRPDEFFFVVTATTREPRNGEIDGYDYNFVSHDEFARMIDDNELLEYAVVYRDYKGVPKQQIIDALASGKNVIMRVDVQGAATVREIIPDVITVFLTPPSEEELVRRLTARKSESDQGIKLRLATARDEMKHLPDFDYCVVNVRDDQDGAIDKILSIVDAARCRVHQKPIIF